MQVFVALKVPRGDANRLAVSQAVAEAVQAAGHTSFVAWQEIEHRGLLPAEFMPFVRQQLGASGLLIVVYHPELRGGLIELGIAYGSGLPIWLAHRPGETVSTSALACAERVLVYTGPEALNFQVRRAFGGKV